jgi:PAS domain S-box-containing protein
VQALLSWPVVVTFGATVFALALGARSWRNRNRPGGWTWLVVLVLLALYTTVYGIALLIFDPTLREVFARLHFGVAHWASVFFLVFALQYTGREYLIRPALTVPLVGGAVLISLLVVTNPVHGLAWSEFQLDPVFGAAGAAFEFGPVLYAHVSFVFVALGLAVLLLAETVASYGTAYRSQALAIAVTPFFVLPTTVALLFELGPVPHLDLGPVALLPHLTVDSYALFGAGMFDFAPATRRVAERAALDEVDSPVVIVNDERRVVNCNAAFESLFGVAKADIAGSELSTVAGTALEPTDDGSTVTVHPDGRRREYRVSASPLTDATGAAVGQTITMQDVTVERRREQRLAVLNRVLRHNLKNELSVITGNVETIQRRAEDETLVDLAETALDRGWALAETGEKARTAVDILDSGGTAEMVRLDDLFSTVTETVSEEGAEAVVVTAAEGVVRADPRLLETAVQVAVENALEHGDGAVRLGARPTDGRVRITITDDGPGIPEHELAVVRDGEEDPLAHGSGLGLWLLAWCVGELGGDLSFDTEGGTTVTVELPAGDTVATETGSAEAADGG